MFSSTALILLFLTFVFVVIPKYLEFRRILGLDGHWHDPGPLFPKIKKFLSGLWTQILLMLTLLSLVLPEFLEGARALDLEAVMPHDIARSVAFWLGFATLISHIFAMLFAAKAKPVETKDSDS